MMEVMLPSALFGWGLLVRDRQESLPPEPCCDQAVEPGRAEGHASRLLIPVRRVVAWRVGTGAGEGIDR